MRLQTLLLIVCANAVVALSSPDFLDSTTIFIQSLEDPSSPISPLAEIKYNPSTLDVELTEYFAPQLPTKESRLVRIGVYDKGTSSWKSATSMISVESFSNGYRPTLVVSLDGQGEVLGVLCKSDKIDAGETRDFGPKVKVLKMAKGKSPELNRPVVLSPEGKVAEPEPEKTMLQKYWWVILGGVMLLMTAGGGGE